MTNHTHPVTLTPLLGFPEVSEGDDLAEIILTVLQHQGIRLLDGDILVVSSKVVSKAMGLRAPAGAQAEVVLSQTVRIVAERMTPGGAIKHGIAPNISGGDLILRARTQDGVILLEVWNSGVPFRGDEAGRGIGVRNLRSRLSLAFGAGGSFSIGPSGQGTLASIRLEATQVEFAHGTL